MYAVCVAFSSIRFDSIRLVDLQTEYISHHTLGVYALAHCTLHNDRCIWNECILLFFGMDGRATPHFEVPCLYNDWPFAAEWVMLVCFLLVPAVCFAPASLSILSKLSARCTLNMPLHFWLCQPICSNHAHRIIRISLFASKRYSHWAFDYVTKRNKTTKRTMYQTPAPKK